MDTLRPAGFTSAFVCPICAAPMRDVLPRYTGLIDRASGLGAFEIVACAACGIDLTRPQPLPETIPSLYEARDSPDFDRPSTWLGRLRTSIVEERLARRIVRTYLPGRAIRAVLEIGPGAGKNIGAFAVAYPKARCAATDFHALRPASLASTVDYYRYGSREHDRAAYDVIILRHVLEHVLEPIAFVREILPALAPGGILFVEVPNGASALMKWAGPKRTSRFYMAPRHVAHHSRRSLARIAALAAPGFEATVALEDYLSTVPLLEEAFSVETKSLAVIALALLLYPLQLAFDRLARSSGALTLVLRAPR